MRGRWLGLAAALVLMTATGCAEKFSRHNYDLVQVGVDEHYDVQKLLGHPTNEVDEAWYYEHPKKDYSAMIHFGHDGKVSGKQWFDSPTGDIADEGTHSGRRSRTSDRPSKARDRMME